MFTKSTRRSTVLAAVTALLFALPVYAQAPREDSRPPVPVLRVSGEAEVSAEPDVATFTVGAEIRDASASKAMAQAAQITDRLIAALTAQGIPRKDIQTTQLTLFSSQEPEAPGLTEGNESRPVTFKRVYVASHILQVEVGKDRFDKIGGILDAAVQAGANQLGNISFGIKDETDLRNQGLAQAVRNARSKAEVLAAAADTRIQGLLTLQEGSIPRPLPYDSNMRTFAMADAAPSPVPPSQIKRTYTVTVEYQIQK